MHGNFKVYYHTTNFVCLCIIGACMYYIQATVDDFYFVKENSQKFKNCDIFFEWKFTVLTTITIFCIGLSFMNYLLFRRRKNYYFHLLIKIGPFIDRTIMIYLFVASILYGPGLMFQIILMFMYYNDINNTCAYTINDPIKHLYLPYCLFGFVFGLLMLALFFILLWKRCSRTSLVNERNIDNINDLIYFI
jgi:hypothetical protein